MTRVSRLTLLPGPRPAQKGAWLGQLLIVIAFGWLVYYVWPIVLGILAMLALSALIDVAFNGGVGNPLKSRSSTESICTFTRALPYRELDPEVIRAVYEELANFCWAEQGRPFPLRPTDLLEDDLALDSEDFEFDVVENIAYRTRRDLVKCEQNPWYGRVNTAGELVAFFNAQPKQLAI